MTENESLSGEDKTFIALAAAMGGGCRTCAQGLFGIARSLDMDLEDIDAAFSDGLGVRDAATRLMWQKARSLRPREAVVEDASVHDGEGRIRDLARLAAAVAANAAPAALGYAEAARASGASDTAVGVAIGIGRTIRGKAQAFSDEELGQACKEDSADGAPVGACGPGQGCDCDDPPHEMPASACS